MFADAKTRGLNLEDTDITGPVNLNRRLGIVAFAMTWAYMTWAYRCATVAKGRSVINRRTHGRREKPWFRTGVDTLRRWLLFDPSKAIRTWTQTLRCDG